MREKNIAYALLPLLATFQSLSIVYCWHDKTIHLLDSPYQMTTKVATARLKIRILRYMDVVFSVTGMYIRFRVWFDFWVWH